MKRLLYTALFAMLFSSTAQAQDLFDINTVRSIYINFEQEEWDSILTANWYTENGERALASITMDGITYDSVAIRYKGNATFYWADETDNPKKPLNIDMNNFISDQKLLGFKKIKLANSLFDPTVLRDVLGLKIYGDYMPAPEANWMKVLIDDEYIGVYPNTEAINKQLLNKHFGYKKGVLVKCDPASQYPSDIGSSDLTWKGVDSTLYYDSYNLKSDKGWAELLKLIDILNNSPEELETILNIDRVLWYLAVSTVTANYDSYNGFYMHNYYLYQNKNGLFQILPWDVSEIFVGSIEDNGIVTGDDIYKWDIFNQNDPFGQNRPLVDYIANHPVYRMQYLAHIRTVLEEVLNETELLEICQEMQAIISDAHADDVNSFFELGSTYFESNITSDMNDFGLHAAGILPTVEKRKKYLQSHPEVSLVPPVISQVVQSFEFPPAGEQVSISALIENGSQVDLLVTKSEYASHFEAIPMLDDGMHGDGLEGDNIYGAFIPFSELDDEVKYYIRAQNSEAMTVNPKRAEYEFHEYKVGQVTSASNLIISQDELIISPNPCSNQVNICWPNKLSGKELQLELYTSQGALIRQETVLLENNQYRMLVENLNTGIYILKVNGFKSGKIIKL